VWIKSAADYSIMESTFRPMTEEEVARLKSLATGAFYPPVWVAAFATGTIVWLLLGVAAAQVLPRPSPHASMWYVMSPLVACIAGAYVYYRRRENAAYERKVAALRTRYAADLQALQLEQWRVRVVDALQVEELEHEGSQFFLELEDGRVLFVISQDFLNGEGEPPFFPNRELLITRLPHAGDIFEREYVGEYFPPSAERGYFRPEEHVNGSAPRDGQILPGPLSRYLIDRDKDMQPDYEH
jgi:hypothetical protein